MFLLDENKEYLLVVLTLCFVCEFGQCESNVSSDCPLVVVFDK